MSTELQQQAASLPEHIRQYLSPTPIMDQMGHVDQSDIGINMIKLAQDTSKETKKVGWGPTGQEPMVPKGSMFLKNDGKILSPGTLFVPLLRTVKYIKWIGKPGQGQMEFMCDTDTDPRIGDGLQFKKDRNTGEVAAPEVTKYVNFYVLLQGQDMPVLISFKRTSSPTGKALTQALVNCTQANRLPYFTFMFTLGTPKIVRDGSLEWYDFTFAPAGYTPSEAIDKAKKMSEMAKALAQMTTAQDFEGEPTRAAEETMQQTPAQHPNAGIVIQGNATVMPPQPVVQTLPIQQPVQPPVQQAPVQQQQQPVAAGQPTKLW